MGIPAAVCVEKKKRAGGIRILWTLPDCLILYFLTRWLPCFLAVMDYLHVSTLALLSMLILATTVESFALKPAAPSMGRLVGFHSSGTRQHDRSSRWSLLSTGNNELDREMDTFLERASLSGSEKISSLTIEQRAARAIRGGEIEDQIFEIRDLLLQMEDDVFAGRNGVTVDQMKETRDLLAKLKEGLISFA